jgi:hypothetical protein
MKLLLAFVLMTFAHVGESFGRGVSASLPMPMQASALLFSVAGALVAWVFLLLIKLPDGRYLYRPWQGNVLNMATPLWQSVLFVVAAVAIFLYPGYYLFWSYLSEWLHVK